MSAVGDIVRVTIAATFPGPQVLECNMHFLCATADGTDRTGTLGAGVYDIFLANLLELMSEDTSLYGWRAAIVNRTPTPAPKTGVGVQPGLAALPPLPSQARPLLRWRTSLGGRKYRGRIFLPPGDQTQITTTGSPSIDYQVAMAALGTALVSPLTYGTAQYNLVIAHRTPGTPPTYTTTPVITFDVAGQFGTQRRSGQTGRTNGPPW
jgi:hypothetical protein